MAGATWKIRRLKAFLIKEEETAGMTQDLSPQDLFNKISRIIAGAKTHQYLTYENIDPATGSLVTESLDYDQKVERIRPR